MVLQQLRLLLGKNLLLRWRHPGILLLEVIWPILIVAIVAVIRVGVPPSEKPTCHYQDRAMPSAGLVPFLQTFVCNLDNKCHSNESKYQVETNAGSISSLVQQVTPYLGDQGTLDLLDNVDDGVTVIETFSALINDSVMTELDNATRLSQYFRDPDKMKTALIQDYGFSQEAVDALMDSQANLTAIMDLAGYPDLKGVACDPERLRMFLYFPEGTDVHLVSQSLCGINESKIPEITDFLQSQLDVAEVIRLLSLFEKLKARISKKYTWADGLRDVADMMDLVMSIDSLMTTVKELASIKGLPDIIRSIPQWTGNMDNIQQLLKPLGGLISSMDPMMSNWFQNDTMWQMLSDSMALGNSILNANGTGSSEELMKNIVSFIHDVDQVYHYMSPELQGTLDSLAAINWPMMLDLVSQAGQNNETVVVKAMGELQTSLEQTPVWPVVSPYLPLVTDSLHTINMIMTQLTDVHEELSQLKEDESLTQTLYFLLGKGPDVTLALLKAFTDPDTLAKLFMDRGSYSLVCGDVIEAIKDEVGQTVASELNATLCYGQLSAPMENLLGKVDIHNISDALDRTIVQLSSLLSGNMTVGVSNASLPALAHQIQMMIHNLQVLSQAGPTTWAELFLPESLSSLGGYSQEWEPVLAMLNEDYLGSSLLSLFRATGRVMNDSDSAEWMEDTFGPIVHMAAVMAKSLYIEMKTMDELYSSQSSLAQLVYFTSTYAPQIMESIMNMDSNGNADMLYRLASSSDPMAMICEDHMLQNMADLPHYFAVRVELIICFTNWTDVGAKLMNTENVFTTAIQDMMTSMTDMTNGNSSTSLVSDWDAATYHISLIMGMVSKDMPEVSEDPMETLTQIANTMNRGPWTLAMYANMTQVEAAFNMAMTHLENMTMDDFNMVLKVVGMVMEGIDRSQSTADYESKMQWRQIKYQIKIVDNINIIIMESLKQDMSQSTSLLATIKDFPQELKNMVYLAAEAYPEFIDALSYALLRPDQLILKLVAQTLQAPNCGNVTVTDYLHLDQSSSFGQLEMDICKANWTELSMKLTNTSQSPAITEAIEELTILITNMNYLTMDPMVNWTQTMTRMAQSAQMMVDQLTTTPSLPSFDLMPFNITAIQAKWSEFYKDLEQLENLDFVALSSAMQALQSVLLDNMAMNGTIGDLMRLLTANNYISNQFIKFLNIQLRYMNASSEVNVLDLMGSDELRKVAQVLRYSPEINEIGVNTLIRVMSDPSSISVTNLESLCTNVTMFSEVVAVNDSVISTPLLQHTLCSLDINTTLLMQQLQQNWDGFAELVHAFEMVMDPDSDLTMDPTEMPKEQMDFNILLSVVIENPPTFTFFDNDQWMNPMLYEGPWHKLSDQLQTLFMKYQDPNAMMGDMQSMILPLLESFVMNPDLKPMLGYLDAILEMIMKSTTSLDSIPQSFENYPNMKMLYSLLEQLPELLEMVFYTAMNHPQQLENWADAMTSWEAFCGADPTTLMTAPAAGGLDVVRVFQHLCSINITQLTVEFNTYEGLDKLNAILSGNMTEPVNMTYLAEKFSMVLSSLENINLTSPSMDFDLRILNSTVWNAVFTRLELNLNQTLQQFMSPEYLLEILNSTSTLFPEFVGLDGTVKQVLAITDIVLDQMLQSFNGGNLGETFSKYPTLSSIVTLMNNLPEIYETLAYTGLYTPEKILEHFSEVMSFETFCDTDITMMLTAPPQSGYDLKAWQDMVCSVNVTVLMEELGDYQGTTLASNIFMPNASFSVNLTSISEKMEKVMSEFNRLMSGNMTDVWDMNAFFNVTAWNGVMRHLQTWMQDASQMWTSASFYKKLMSASVLSSLQTTIPELTPALQYTSVILDMVEQQLDTSGSLEDMFSQYPTLQSLVSLLDYLPEMYETVVYTVLYAPDKVMMRLEAFSSLETFCLADMSAMITVPAEVNFDVGAWQTQFCSLNFTLLMAELAQYQNTTDLSALFSFNNTMPLNITSVEEKIHSILDKLSAMNESTALQTADARFLNASLWETANSNLEKWMANPNALFWMRQDKVMQMYMQMLQYSNMTELLDAFRPMYSVLGLVMDRLFLYENKTSFTLDELFVGAPQMQKMVQLLQQPGVIEVLFESINSEQFAPLLRTDNMTEIFIMLCSPFTSLNQYLTVPGGVTIDLVNIKTRLCSIDLQSLPEEIMNFFDIDQLMAALNGSLPVDYDALTQQFGRLSALTERWSVTPPVFNLPTAWLNESFWLGILERYTQAREDPNTILEELDRFIKSLGPAMTEDPMRQVALVTQTILRLLNENMMALPSQNLTMENLVLRVPILQEVFSALGIEGEILDAMLKAPFQSSQMVIEALLSDGTTTQNSICNATRLQELMQLPASFNTTALYQAVCMKNATEALDNLVRNLDLQGLIAGLESPTVTANWTQILLQSEELQQQFNKLIANPPSFNASSLMALLDSTTNTSNLWQMASMFNNFQPFGMLDAFPELKWLEDMNRVQGVILELLTDMMDRLVVDGMSVDLASLFSSSPSFVRLVDAALQATPDPVSALSFISLNPAKANEFMEEISGDNMQSIMCTPSEFESYFIFPAGTNVTELMEVLCSLNFTLFVEELSDNFMVEAWAKKFAMAMNSSAPLNMQKYVNMSMSLVDHITALTGVKNVTFDGRDLAHVFDVNTTKLLEAMESYSARLEAEYAALSSFSLNSALASLVNSSEGQGIMVVLKAMEVYLHSFNRLLEHISSGPITLAAIVNNTEVGNIIMPFLQDPHTLQDLLDLELLPQKLETILMDDDAISKLCGPELFMMFAAPGNESTVLQQLQTSVCNANATVMLWQAVLGQANGYQLYQQIEMLSKEIAAGRASANVTAIDGEIQQLIAMVTQLVMEYQNGTRSTDDLLDWRSFENIFSRFGASVGDKLMNMSQEWSMEMVNALMPALPDDEMSSNARMINTINIFMNIINDRLDDMIKNGVNLYTLLNHSDALVNLMEAYLDVTRLTPQAWLDKQFNMTRVIEVTADPTMLSTMCQTKTLALYLADNASDTTVATTLQTVMCSVITELPAAFTQFIDYEDIQMQLETLWNLSLPVEPQYKEYAANTQRFSELITQLATSQINVDPQLASRFNFTGMLGALEDIATQPEIIFRLLKMLGVVIDGPMSTNDLQNVFFGVDTYVAQPMLALLQYMDQAGLSFARVLKSPSQMLQALPVLMNFNLQFDIMTSVYLQPTINKFWNRDYFRNNHFCNGQLPPEVFTSSGVDPSIVNTLCAIPPTDWIPTLKRMNYTDAQILSWVTQVDQKFMTTSYCYDTTDTVTGQNVTVCSSSNADMMDNKGRYWMRLMSTLESVVSLLDPNGNEGNINDTVDSLSRLMDVLQDAFLNKTLNTAMNYLEAVDRMGVESHDWLVFKQVMGFLQSAGDLLNSGLQNMIDPSGTVHLENLLPDSQQLAQLLSDVLGPTSASEMMAASVNPDLFYQLLSMDQLATVACNPMQFSALFMFPTGTNVTAVQVDLCEAVTSREVSVQKLIDFLKAGNVLKQLEGLMKGSHIQTAGPGLWQALSTTVSSLLTTIDQLQKGQINATISSTWANPILQQLMAPSQQSMDGMDAMCQSFVAMIGDTFLFQQSQADLVLISKVMKIAARSTPLASRLSELMCIIVAEDGLDLAAGVVYMRQYGLEGLLEAVSDLMTNGTQGEFQCHDLMSSMAVVNLWIMNMTESPSLNMDNFGRCLEDGLGAFTNITHGLSQLYTIMTDISNLLKEEDIQVLMRNSGQLSKMLDYIMGIFTQEAAMYIQFVDLLSSDSTVESYLMDVLKLAPDAVFTFLSSTIKFNASTFLNNSITEIADTLCDPARLDDVMELPSLSPFNTTTLSAMLCTDSVNVTAAVLKDAGKAADLVSELTSMLGPGVNVKFVDSLTNSLIDLVSQLQSVSTLIDLMGGDFDDSLIMANADSIDAILAGGGTIHQIVDSLTTLVGTLKLVVPTEDHYIITDIQTFISGLLGLDLIQTYLVEAIGVADLQKDAYTVHQYLMNELGFSPEAATAILSSTYSIRVFVNASALVNSNEPCEDQLARFILMNTTAQLQEEVVSKFCELNSTESTAFFQLMVPELDIGDIVQQYVTFSGDEILDSLNMTTDKIRTVFRSLVNGSQSLEDASVYLVTEDSPFTALLTGVGDSSSGEFDAMQSLQPTLCGLDSSTEVSDQFNLDSKIQGASSPQDLAEEAQLNGDFCIDLYRSVKSSKMGSVIWAYLKPIMSGKILFTPDNTLTRQIVTEANWVFDTMSEVKRVAKKWSEKVPSLVSLTSSNSYVSDLKDILNNGFVQGVLRSTLDMDPSTLVSGLDALGQSNVNATNLKALQSVAELVYNYSTCLDLQRFEAVATEEELETRAFELYKTNNFLGGIVFMNLQGDSGSQRKKRDAHGSNHTLPPHVMYKIRMDMDNVRTTNRIKDRLWLPDPEDDFASDLRYMRGFIQLQDMVEGAILRQQTGANYSATGVSMQQMPFPCHTEDTYLHYLGSYLLPILMTFAWLAAIGIATHTLVYDRQSGQEESLRIMGMASGLNTLSWLLVTMLIMALVAIVVTIIFKYAGVFQHSNWFLLLLYILDFCFSTTMMCYFISSFFSRVTLAILSVVIIYFMSFLPYIILISAEVHMTMWQKSLACLFSTTAFSFGAIFVTRFEEEGVGLQWDKMDDKMGDSVDFAWMCYMMLIDSAIYLVLGWYIRNVKPGKYGVKQPWYFPVLPSYWCSCVSSSTERLPAPKDSGDQSLFEPAPQGLDIGISVRGLRKTFKGTRKVVHGIDVDIYHDQITTILGHNGAAKTTTLNMLVGVLNPSGGVVLVEGKKTQGRTGLLGLCPQHNTLYEHMTVIEHMEFYGGVKGNLSSMELHREIRKLLHDVDLWHVKDEPALNLSGGMQRRLCVAMAFVGGSKTIVLDEPTSGVDPHARKNIWNLILKNRPGRTILMSTHHLDEADTLSDRILVMHSGSLLAVGSPAYLKDRLGGGYKLRLNTNPTLDVQNEMQEKEASPSTEDMSSHHAGLMSFIKERLPSASFVESVGTDLTVSITSQTGNSSDLAEFFRQLDAQKSELGVLSYGISNTTLEEVFLKLTAEADAKYANSGFDRSINESNDSESVSTHSDNTILRPYNGRPQRTVQGTSLKFQQLGALLVKRVHHYRRNWRMLISALLLPLLAFLLAMAFTSLRPVEDDMKNLIMSPALYSKDSPETYSFIKDNRGNEDSRHFMSTLMADLPGIGTTCMADFNPGEDFSCVNPSSLHESPKMEQVCHCSDNMYVCEDGPQLEGIVQMLTRPDVTLQNLGAHDPDVYLTDSYMNYINQRFGGWTLEPPNNGTNWAKVWFNNKGYHAIPAYYNALSNNLLRSAVSPNDSHNYGITLYSHPLMLNSEQLSKESIESSATDVGIAMVILLALSFIPSAFMVYLTNERVSHEKHLQAISGVGNVLYWSTTFLWDMIVYSCSLAIMVIVIVIFKSEGFYDRQNLDAFALLVFLFGWAVIPLMYCTLRLFKSGSAAYLTLFCLNMLLGLLPTLTIFILDLLNTSDGIDKAAEVLRYVFLIFPQFCLGMGLVDLVSNQFQYKLLKRFGEDTYVDPFDFDMLGWNFVALGAHGLVFILLTFFIHSCKKRAASMTASMHYNASKEDQDVFGEQERVRAGGDGDSLSVKELSKVYTRGSKKFCAVNHLSFGVQKGECFGLLGVNGAGKTTTFKMLTGDTTPSDGDSFIQHRQLSTLRSHLGDQIGYCPQEDALDMYLSGRETLTFHAKLRGFGSDQIEGLVSEQLKQLHLESLADKAVRTYSGGNKRKLALAVAMLGDPPLLLLDEPTTGMDVATRRLAWKCITNATSRGQSVLLTSHSMDECDSLCSRLAIMVNGQLKCIGSPQHLKHKFGDGYTVTLHLQGLSSSHFSVAEAFMAQFPGSVIKDQHHSVMEVSIPRGAGSVADIFSAVQQAQQQHQIYYYSVSQTTLDTVFISFARDQTDDGDQDSEMDSSSGGSSGESSNRKDSSFQKSMIGGSYAYMNPEYASGPIDSFSASAPAGVPPVGVTGFDNKTYDSDFFSTKL